MFLKLPAFRFYTVLEVEFFCKLVDIFSSDCISVTHMGMIFFETELTSGDFLIGAILVDTEMSDLVCVLTLFHV